MYFSGRLFSLELTSTTSLFSCRLISGVLWPFSSKSPAILAKSSKYYDCFGRRCKILRLSFVDGRDSNVTNTSGQDVWEKQLVNGPSHPFLKVKHKESCVVASPRRSLPCFLPPSRWALRWGEGGGCPARSLCCVQPCNLSICSPRESCRRWPDGPLN